MHNLDQGCILVLMAQIEFGKEKLDKNIKENGLTRFGVKRPHTVFVMIAIVIILGVFAFSSLRVELFPNMNIPFVVIMSTANRDANDEILVPTIDLNNPLTLAGVGNMFDADGNPTSPAAWTGVTRPNPLDMSTWHATPSPHRTFQFTQVVEGLLGIVSGIRNVDTISNEGSMMIIVELNSGANMDAAESRIGNFVREFPFRDVNFSTAMVTRIDLNMMPVFTFSSSFYIPIDPEGNGVENIDFARTRNWYNNNVVPALRMTAGVADVDATGLDNISGFSFFNGQPSFSFAVRQNSDAITTETTANIRATLSTLVNDLDGFNYNVIFDQGEFINESIGNVLWNLIIGAVLCILVLFLFLRNIKLTLAVGIAIPLSVIGTFVLMYFMGIGLNVVSMSGLALVVGMLVDNSVIVIENIYRLRRKGMSIRESAIKGASQIFGAVVAATLTTVAVFVPMFFVSGMMMEIFMDLVWVIILSLSASLVVAVMFLPSIVAAFKICPDNKSKSTESVQPIAVAVEGQSAAALDTVVDAEPIIPAGKSQGGFKTFMDNTRERTYNWFNAALAWTIKKKWITVAIALFLFLASLPLVIFVNGFELMPAQDSGHFSATITINRTFSNGDRDLERITAERVAVGDPAVATDNGLAGYIRGLLGNNVEDVAITYIAAGGGGMFGGGTGGGGARMTINVTLRNNRSITTAAASETVYTGITRFLTTRDMLVTEDVATHDNFAGNVALSSSGMTMASENIIVTIAAPRGTITEQMAALGPAVTAITERINAQIGHSGGVLRITDNFDGDVIRQSNRQITASVTVHPREGFTLSQLQSAVDREVDWLRNNDPRMQNITPMSAGFGADMDETLSQMLLALAVGLLLMYLVMVAIFRSFKSPLIILVTVPLAFTGGFLLLFIVGMPMSIVAMIGLMVLMGVIINNGIVLIDYINQARRDGLKMKEALVAASNTRARPIIMTGVSTILAMLPMAIGWGTGGELMQPLAIITIGGLVYATFVSLLVVPAFYAIFNRDKEDKEAARERRRIRREQKNGPKIEIEIKPDETPIALS